ncbi:FadR/GntR family transcriptional regulator [Lysobacter firmicutimachus]|uniref:FadR/GntR family transcriptional regulator n=1 Tax=Lysobacter firmicutimachus TaxID=1792846 RepID=A0AAU8MXI4_9GAMM
MNRLPRPASLTRRIVESLGGAIVAGHYGPQQAFPTEAELCVQLRASRSIVREAVKMLTAKGLLSARPKRGTVIEPEARWNFLDPDVLRWLLERKFSADLLLEFTQMRLAVEPMAAMLAARRGDAAAIARIDEALARMRAAESGRGDALESDIAFHVAVLEASGNRFYAGLRDLVESALRISIVVTNRSKGVDLASVEDHVRVYEAIAAGDAERARAAMQGLLDEVAALIESTVGRSRAA